MNRYKKSRLIVAISVILLLSCSLLYVTKRGNSFFQGVVSDVSRGLGTIERFLAQPTQFFSKQKESLSDLLEAYEENKELKQTLVSLEEKVLETKSLQAENESLRQSLEMKNLYADKTLVAAMVTLRLPISWTNKVVIDAGTSQNVQKGMLIIANGGLVGLVESVEEQTATVKLLTNADEFTKIPVKITTGTTAIYGILSGYDSDQEAFIVNQLNSVDDIAVGSNVVTSDLGGTTPSNIQIGTVLSVNQKKGSFDRELFIKPSADFGTLYSVLVVGE